MRRHPRRLRPRRLRQLRQLRHHPIAYWTLVGTLALTTGLTVSSLIGEARTKAAAYGEVERVAVARRTIDAGEVFASDDFDWRERPSALVPDEPALDLVDRVATATTYAGEVVVVSRLAPDGLSGVAALVPAGRQAVAVPLSVGTPTLVVGDVVDLVAVVDPSAAAAARVVRAAPVVEVSDDDVTIAVADDEVRPTAVAIATGSVVIALTGER